MVDNLIADLKDCIKETKISPSGGGQMVRVYGRCFVSSLAFWYSESSKGLGSSSAVGPSMVGQLATAFLDAMYKA